MKSILFTAATAVAGIAGCQAPAPSQPAPAPKTCTVYAGWDEVIPATDPRQAQLDGSCSLNLIRPTGWPTGSCETYGGHRGTLPDTCYDVDY
jgi:hypothetical protein